MNGCYRCGGPGYKTDGQGRVLCESLAFRGSCEDLKPRQVTKEPGRNDPCSCGSGRKFKKCCLNKDNCTV